MDPNSQVPQGGINPQAPNTAEAPMAQPVEPVVPVPTPTAPTPVESFSPVTEGAPPQNPAEGDKKSSPLLVISLALLGVALLVVIAYVVGTKFMKPKNTTSQIPAPTVEAIPTVTPSATESAVPSFSPVATSSASPTGSPQATSSALPLSN